MRTLSSSTTLCRLTDSKKRCITKPETYCIKCSFIAASATKGYAQKCFGKFNTKAKFNTRSTEKPAADQMTIAQKKDPRVQRVPHEELQHDKENSRKQKYIGRLAKQRCIDGGNAIANIRIRRSARNQND